MTRSLPPGFIALPPPDIERGATLAGALARRRSVREFAAQPLEPPVLSNLLWAACGVNRPDTGQRTAASARDWQEIDVYVVTEDAVRRYDAARHALAPVAEGDHRAATGLQDFPARAPLNLVYVANLGRMSDSTSESRELYSAIDTGLIAQNVYLYCAAAGLACVLRGLVDRVALAHVLRLGPQQRVIAAQSVGYPAAAPAAA